MENGSRNGAPAVLQPDVVASCSRSHPADHQAKVCCQVIHAGKLERYLQNLARTQDFGQGEEEGPKIKDR